MGQIVWSSRLQPASECEAEMKVRTQAEACYSRSCRRLLQPKTIDCSEGVGYAKQQAETMYDLWFF